MERAPLVKKDHCDATVIENTIFSDVVLETAGTVDLDIEIKFVIGSVPYIH